jgi:hypothetical protein
MADTAGKLALDVLLKDCRAYSCPYRAGDSQKARNSLVEILDHKLKHRVADGNEVRILEARVKSLETALRNILAQAINKKDKGLINTAKMALVKKT